jgi:hypothetical protein
MEFDINSIEFKGIDLFEYLKSLPENTNLVIVKTDENTWIHNKESNELYFVG